MWLLPTAGRCGHLHVGCGAANVATSMLDVVAANVATSMLDVVAANVATSMLDVVAANVATSMLDVVAANVATSIFCDPTGFKMSSYCWYSCLC